MHFSLNFLICLLKTVEYLNLMNKIAVLHNIHLYFFSFVSCAVVWILMRWTNENSRIPSFGLLVILCVSPSCNRFYFLTKIQLISVRVPGTGWVTIVFVHFLLIQCGFTKFDLSFNIVSCGVSLFTLRPLVPVRGIARAHSLKCFCIF